MKIFHVVVVICLVSLLTAQNVLINHYDSMRCNPPSIEGESIPIGSCIPSRQAQFSCNKTHTTVRSKCDSQCSKCEHDEYFPNFHCYGIEELDTSFYYECGALPTIGKQGFYNRAHVSHEDCVSNTNRIFGTSFTFGQNCQSGDSESVKVYYNTTSSKMYSQIWSDIMCTGKLKYGEIFDLNQCVQMKLPGRVEYHLYWRDQENKDEL
jgi:hypothetical protein